MKALMDGDEFLYAVGFSVEKERCWVYTMEGEFLFSEVGKRNTYKQLEGFGLTKSQVEIEVEKEIAPIHHLKNNFKILMNSILRQTEAEDYIIYLGDGTNFREDIDPPCYETGTGYKGNRDPNYKPYHYEEFKSWMIDKYNVEVVSGMESDDAMGIASYKAFEAAKWYDDHGAHGGIKNYHKTIICSQDKDMDMIPGWHYNRRRKEKYWITEQQGLENFWRQMLLGDSADNIKSITRTGPVTANMLLDGLTISQMEEVVRLEYGAHFKDSWKSMFDKNKKLLWILRKPLSGE